MKIYDPIHGFIHFSADEERLIDTTPFQRLRYIRQLGVIHLVFPGATHTRFEHSLGVMNFASSIFGKLFDPKNVEEVFQRSSGFSEKEKALLNGILNLSQEEKQRKLKVLRLAALCHDLGHLPFSHTAEQSLLGSYGHEKKTIEIIFSKELEALWESLKSDLGDHIATEVAMLSAGQDAWASMGYKEKFSNMDLILSDIITNDYFGADRIDCLLRDASSTGVTHGLFDYEQLIDSLRLLPYQDELSIGVLRSGISSIESLLVSRYFMYSRVYRHPIGAAYSYHLEQVFLSEYKNSKHLLDIHTYMRWSDSDVLVKVKELAAKEKTPMHAHAILDRAYRYKVLWLCREDLEGIDLDKLKCCILDLEKQGTNIFSRFSDAFISGEIDFHAPQDLIALQWGAVQKIESKFSYPNLTVSSSYLYVEPSAVSTVKKYLNEEMSIFPKFY